MGEGGFVGSMQTFSSLSSESPEKSFKGFELGKYWSITRFMVLNRRLSSLVESELSVSG